MPTSSKDSSFLKEEIQHYFTLLTEEITNYDCGNLCKSNNSEIPFCCKFENATPILYKNEYRYLASISTLWSVWKPTHPKDKLFKKKNEGYDTVFCRCKGVKFCERENRSISCRTFPLEPYIDKRGVFIGLVFMKEFSSRCPLTNKPEDIRQEFIDSHFLFWERFLLRKREELELYFNTSKRYRSSRGKTGKDFIVLFPSHLKGKDYLLKYI